MSKTTVAFQGELGAYSEMAARQFFRKTIQVKPCYDFETVFKTCGRTTESFGVIPIENSLAGSIHENYDHLLSHDRKIIGEIKLRIAHNLIALPGTGIKKIKKVFSHPQALAQCSDFLKKIKGAEIIAEQDTAGAVKMIRDKKIKDAAAVASLQAAIDYEMKVLAKNIESNKANYTRFLILGKKPLKISGKWKTSIVFSFKNVPGALFKCLGVFAMRDIDLFKIESRPLHGKPWAYLFYLDFEGRLNNEKRKNALNHLKEITSFIKVLGTYPEGKVAEPVYGKR